MTKCPYRSNTKCEQTVGNCQLCLAGQQANELSLISSALANLTASIEERLANEHKVRKVICSPICVDEHCTDCKHAKPHDFIDVCDEGCFFSNNPCKKQEET